MDPVYRDWAVLGAGVMLQHADSLQAMQPELPPRASRGQDPLETVGIALLAYGLVQLLSKVIDKLPTWRAPTPEAGASSGGAQAAGAGFNAEDRKRLERLYDQSVDDRQRLERIEEMVRDQMTVHQRLVGQAFDELRELRAKIDDVLRKLRALWTRFGRRKRDRG